jgi:hypothetical protein
MRYVIVLCFAAWTLALSAVGVATAEPQECCLSLCESSDSFAERKATGWPKIELAQPQAVAMTRPVGAMLERGLARLAEPPYTADWLLADVSRKTFRVFANYSGDVSGRFLELATLTSTPERPQPGTLTEMLKSVAAYQRPDGHFGADFDLTKDINVKDAVWKWAPNPMLWGNARLLVGLVTAAKQFNEPGLLAAAKKLGDFYVNSADQLCTPKRLDEYRASGTYAASYTCCYFPAIEALAMLYKATGDERYLRQAEKIAEHFKHFDALPTDHSHSNLCAYRGILMLYEITGKREYLDRAVKRWTRAVEGGYVWPTGGVGEHWYVNYSKDEGCGESDWLRFNLDLWRLTGETRCLDIAERLLHNQIPANQSANGGFGVREFEGDEKGPIAVLAAHHEAPYCCSFHVPLGLHFLKGYLAAASDQAIYVNLPLSFEAPLRVGGSLWSVKVKTTATSDHAQWKMGIETAPQEAAARPVGILVRAPIWADKIQIVETTGAIRGLKPENGYLKLRDACQGIERFTVTFSAAPVIEGRRFQRIRPKPGQISRLDDVSLVLGPNLLYAPLDRGKGRMTLLASIDENGQIDLLRHGQGNYASVELPGSQATEAQIHQSVASADRVALLPINEAMRHRWSRLAFAHDLVVVPKTSITAAAPTPCVPQGLPSQH